MTSDIAHELRTPLTTLKTHIEAIIDGVWEMTPERLEGCHEEVIRLSKLVKSLEQLNKLEKLNIIANDENNQLREQLKNYTSSKGIEALARDNLKMVGKDEVLVVIKQ
jgi:signal transduction histidine kinase